MDITHNQIDLDSQMSAIDMTSNIENPKYKLLNLKVKEQTECLNFDSDVLSIVVICGILNVEIHDNITSSYSELEGFHIKSDLKRIKITGQNNCEILIGSTADLKIFTNENKEKLTDEILDFSNYKVSKPWGWEIWYSQNIGNTPYALKNIHMETSIHYDKVNYLQKSQLIDIDYVNLPRSLKYSDKLSMSCGVENRVPFLDEHLASYCFHLENNLKIRIWVLIQANPC